MVIDIHTSIWSNPDQLGRERAEALRRQQAQHWGQFDASVAAHEVAMRCVDGAVVLGFRSERLNALIPNEVIAEFVARDQQRRIGIAGVDPMADDIDRQLDAAISLGLSGIALSPPYQGFHPQHSTAMRLYERCVEAGMPVFVTLDSPITSGALLEFARPVLWDEVARSVPGLSLVFGQLGHPWIDETLMLLAKHANVYADISGVAGRPWQLYNALLNAVSMGVMDKLLFGSGFPFQMPAKIIETMYSINTFSHGTQLPSIPRTQIRRIVERDSLTCLGIDAVVTPRHRPDHDDDIDMLGVGPGDQRVDRPEGPRS